MENTIQARQDAISILVYSDITDGFARSIVDALRAGKKRPVDLRINSGGGAVTETLGAFNALVQHPGRVDVTIDGLAASSASLLAMAGDYIRIARMAVMMLHDPWLGGAGGTSADLRRAAEVLDKHSETMAAGYARKSGRSEDEIRELMRAETWLSAPEAVKAGFADEVIADEIAAHFDLSNFNAPHRIKTMTDTKTDKPEMQAVPGPDETIRAEHARIQARNEQLRRNFGPFLHQDTARAVYDEALSDPTITVEAAGQMFLAKMAEGAEPITPQGYAPSMPDPTTPQVSGGHHNRGDEFQAAVTDSLLMRYGVPVKAPHPAAQDVRGMSVADISEAILSQNGKTVRGSFGRGKTKAEIIQAAMSTSDFPALLENVANKALMTGFRESEAASHRVWTREGSLPDFKEARRTALSEAPSLSKVQEGGEYTHGSLTDASEPIQLSTYGRIVKVTRHALVNDDLGELARLPLAMGQAAARTEANDVYNLLIGNPQMRDGTVLFHADHSNIGTAAALGIDALGEARALMRRQRGIAGEATLNITPRFLIVPASLETAAEQLLASIAPAKVGDSVPEWVRQLDVVVDSRLDDDSETAWYLAAHPDSFDTIEVARLDGNGAESFTEEEFKTDSMSFKVRLDTGAAVLDWRGLVFNEGA